MRRVLLVVLASLCGVVGTAAAGTPWTLVKRGTPARAGELAVVGAIVKRPSRVGFRAVVPGPQQLTLTVISSCRRGLVTRVGRSTMTGTAPFTKAVALPLADADHCAVSATGSNPAGTLRLELLRGR